MKSKHRILITLTTIVFHQLATTASAQSPYNWTSTSGSSWANDANWSGTGTPLANETAAFTNEDTVSTITLDDNQQIKVLSFTNANATWSLNEGSLSGAKLNITDGDATANEGLGVSATVTDTTLNLDVGLGAFTGSAASDEAVFVGNNGTVNLTKAFSQRITVGTTNTVGSVAMIYNLDATNVVAGRLSVGFNNNVSQAPSNNVASTFLRVNQSQTSTIDQIRVAGGTGAHSGVMAIRNGATWTQNGGFIALGYSTSNGGNGKSTGRIEIGEVGSTGNLTLNNTALLSLGNGAGTGILNVNNGTLTIQANTDTAVVTLGDAPGTFVAANGAGHGTINLNTGGTLVTQRQFARNATALANAVGSGTFTFDGGLLQINRATGNVTTDLFGDGVVVNIQNGGARIDTLGNSTVINRALNGTGNGGLEKLGTGTLTLGGANTYKGDTVVTEGVVAVNGNSIPDSTALRINGTGSKVDVTAASVEVVGTLYFDGTPQAFGSWGSTASTATNKDDTRFSGSGVVYSVEAANDQSFVWAGTGLSDSWSDFFSWTPVGLPSATDSAAFTTLGTAPTIHLDGNQEIKTLTFSDANATWNIEEGSLPGAKLNFTDGDATGNENIIATVNLTHTTLNLNAAIGAFAGSNAGDEVIFSSNGSTVNLSKPSATRTGLGASEVSGAADATYNINATNIITNRLHVGFNETPSNGPQNAIASTFIRVNADQASTDEIRMGGGTGTEFGVMTIRNNANWTQNGSVMLIGYSGTSGTFNRSQGRVEVGEAGSAGFLTIASGGNLIVGERGGLGVLDITNGTLTALADADTDTIGLGWTGSALDGGGDGIINLNTGGTLITSRQFLRNATAVANNTGSGTFNFNGGLLQIDAPQASTLTDLFSDGIALNIAGGARIDTNGNDVMIMRAIGSTGSGSLEKLGLGTLTLSGTNTYAGNTLVTAGTLEVTTDDVFADASTVDVKSGASLSLTHGGTDQVSALIINNLPQLPGVYAFGGGSLEVAPVAGNDYAAWASANSVSGGPGGDSDNDGVKNLIEYALINGGERGSFNTSTRTVTFNKRGAPYGGDITYAIESSTNLTSWTPLATPPAVEDATKIEYTLPAPSPGQPRIFTRLRVSETP